MKSLFRYLVALAAVLPVYASSSAPSVVVTVPPIHSLVSAVMAGVAQPGLVYQAGQSPHHGALAPSSVRLVQNADLLIWVGPGLESGLGRAVSALDPDRVMALGELDDAGLLPMRSIAAPDDHGSEDHEEHEHEHEHEHDRGSVDPHFWLSPLVATAVVRQVALRLAEIDGVNAALYANNAAQLVTKLERWYQQALVRMQPLGHKPFIVFHDAWQYFEQAFGLDQVAVVAYNPERSVGARHLRELRKLVVEREVVCLFIEPQFAPEAAAVILEGTDARSGMLDPLGTTIEPGENLWFALMDRLLDDFAGCVSSGQ